MKLRKTLLMLGLAGTGLVGLTIGLPLLLTSCANEEKTQNPISFDQITEPVQPGTEVKIVANVSGLENYNVTWSYSANNNNEWIGIKSGITNTNSTSTLTIPAEYVTADLNNVVFKLTITNKTTSDTFSAQTKIKVANVEFTNPVNQNIKITVSGNTGVVINKSVTLKAEATCSDPNITNFGYQWYYRQKVNSVEFYHTNFMNNKASAIDGWTSCGVKANAAELTIPEANVTSVLANYEFMVVAYDVTNNDQYNISTPVEISFNPISALGSVQVGSMMTNVVNGVTKSFTNPETLISQVTPNSNPVITNATANVELTNKIATALGLDPTVIQSVVISLGDNLVKDHGFWNGNNVSLDIVVTLKAGYTFGEKQTATGCNDVINNSQACITFEGNTLTISNIQTGIKNMPCTGDSENSGSPSAKLQQLSSKILSYNWNNFSSLNGINVSLNQQTLPLFEDFASYLNVPLACIANINISGNKNVVDPSEESYNMLSFTLQFKRIDLTNFNDDGLSGTNGNFVQGVGNSILEFQISDCPSV